MPTMRKIFISVAMIAVGVFGAYGLYSSKAANDRVGELQTTVDQARAACTRFNEMIPAESRAMWPANATPEERMMFVLDQKQRELDARSGNHYPGGARLSVRFVELPVVRQSHVSPKQSSLASQE